MSDTFKTISTATEGLFKDKGSKFISFAIPIEDVNEIKEVLKEYKKKYFDARHVCYAYMIGHERVTFRANDDGEPSGTAGRTILGQINSYQLTTRKDSYQEKVGAIAWSMVELCFIFH